MPPQQTQPAAAGLSCATSQGIVPCMGISWPQALSAGFNRRHHVNNTAAHLNLVEPCSSGKAPRIPNLVQFIGLCGPQATWRWLVPSVVSGIHPATHAANAHTYPVALPVTRHPSLAHSTTTPTRPLITRHSSLIQAVQQGGSPDANQAPEIDTIVCGKIHLQADAPGYLLL